MTTLKSTISTRGATAACFLLLLLFFLATPARADTCAEDDPCVHGVCEDIAGPSTFCNCTDSGYIGEFCETNFDDCEGITCCQNGGVCQDHVGFYSCNCTFAHGVGELCEDAIVECTGGTGLCEHESTCTRGFNSS